MAARLRICTRCQLDTLAAVPSNLLRHPIAGARRRTVISPSQWLPKRQHSDIAAVGDNEAPGQTGESQDEPDNFQDAPQRTFIEPGRPTVRFTLYKNSERGEALGPGGPTQPSGFRRRKNQKPWDSPADPPDYRCFRDITSDDVGKTIKVRGWLTSCHVFNSKGLIFGKLLQDGVVLQITHSGDGPVSLKDPAYLKRTKLHTPIEVEGRLQVKEDAHPDAPLLDRLELLLKKIVQLSYPPTKGMTKGLTFDNNERYLQLRTDNWLSRALRLRNKVSIICREHLASEGFLEVETPLLFKSTPEGAREFLVPTRKPGYMYALPQSPQQYKQMLMAGGVHKYFQLAKCFRDEDLRADRQPEFTQLDMEMAFASGEDVQRTVERLLKRLWWEILDVELDDFPVLYYHDAISQYGSDKPDLRFEPQILRLREHIDATMTRTLPPEHYLWNYQIMRVPNIAISGSKYAEISEEVANPGGGIESPLAGPNPDVRMMYYHSQTPPEDFRDFLLQLIPYLADDPEGLVALVELLKQKNITRPNNILVIGRRRREFNPGGSTPIGIVRKILAEKLVKYGVRGPLTGYKFVWVTRFPLFTRVKSDDDEPGQSGRAGYKSTHHPFTAPVTNEGEKLFIKPWETLGQHYDIVLNGVEIGGGSTRIHHADLQRSVLEDILQVPPDKMKLFEHLLKMLDSGCPPHAGLAIGFDRLVALMYGTNNIRDVIAFPKDKNGADPTVESPARVRRDRLGEYSLMLKPKEVATAHVESRGKDNPQGPEGPAGLGTEAKPAEPETTVGVDEAVVTAEKNALVPDAAEPFIKDAVEAASEDNQPQTVPDTADQSNTKDVQIAAAPDSAARTESRKVSFNDESALTAEPVPQVPSEDEKPTPVSKVGDSNDTEVVQVPVITRGMAMTAEETTLVTGQVAPAVDTALGEQRAPGTPNLEALSDVKSGRISLQPKSNFIIPAVVAQSNPADQWSELFEIANKQFVETKKLGRAENDWVVASTVESKKEVELDGEKATHDEKAVVPNGKQEEKSQVKPEKKIEGRLGKSPQENPEEKLVERPTQKVEEKQIKKSE